MTDRLATTQAFWNGLTGEEGEYARQAEYGGAQWAAKPNWGDWSIPESELRLLPASLSGLDAVELGCGTAYFSAWLAQAGARPVGVDASARQLALARTLQLRFGINFPLVHADAEKLPFADGSFDLALSEYGASSWCDPYYWIPEAARLLRPGGRLVFLVVSPFLAVCQPEDGGPAVERLQRNYFGLREMVVPTFGTTEFHLPYGEWVRLLRRSGLLIEDLTEIQPPPDARTLWPFVELSWARRWPSECVWTARRPE
jgi:SAM-dependent methyltransferase